MRRRILDQSHRHTLRDSHTDEEIVFHHRNDFGLDRLPTEVLLARNENTSSRASCTACCGLEQPADSDFASELPRMGGALLGTRVGCTCATATSSRYERMRQWLSQSHRLLDAEGAPPYALG
jgi:hypothetical protein